MFINKILPRKLNQISIALLCVAFLGQLTGLKAQINMPPNFTHTLLSSGWIDPVGITYDANGVGYLWEKRGKVWRVNANGIKQTPVLLDIADEVGNWRAHGMLGFALDPNFTTNGYIYCLYVVDRYALLNMGTPGYSTTTNQYNSATIGRITRYQVNTATFTSIVPGSRLVLVGETKSTGFPILHESHGAGSLVFGKDGSLLASFGDGADYGKGDTGSEFDTYYQQALLDSIITPEENIGSYRAQYLSSLSGKILRLNPANGNGLPSNPFYDGANPRSPQSRIWAIGFRNPFRMTLMPNTGVTDITAGDPGLFAAGEVGWNSWEETNIITRGGNYGWPFYEGITPAATFPLYFKYNYDAPNPLYGVNGCTQQYFYFQNLLKQNSYNANTNAFKNPCDPQQLIPANIPVFFHQPPAIDWKHEANYARVPVFGIDTLLADTLGSPGNSVAGSSFPGNCSVTGTFYNDNRFPPAYQGTLFQADYGALWIKSISFNNDNKVTAVNTFADSVGSIVFLTVRPQDGCLTYITLPNSLHKICYTANINNFPTARINLVSPANYGPSPLTLQFNGAASTDPENQITSYLWEFDDGTTSTDTNPTHIFQYAAGVPHMYKVKLTVTDNVSQQSSDSIIVSINNTPPVVNITSIIDSSLYHITTPTYYDLIANVTDAEHTDAQLYYEWQSVLHHNNHLHPEPKDTEHVTSTIINPDGCDDVFLWEINLTVTDPEGLSSSDTVRVYPKCQLPDLDFTASDQTPCIGDTVTYTNTSFNGLNFTWTFNGGTVVSWNESEAKVVYNSPGSYSASLRGCNKLGCDSLLKTAYITIDTLPVVTATNSGASAICYGTSTTINSTVIANSTYAWYQNNTLITGAAGSSLAATQEADYFVQVINSNGCKINSNIVHIDTISPVASVLNTGKDTICPNTGTLLKVVADNAVNYKWYKNNILIGGAIDSVYNVLKTGSYKAVVSFANTCVDTSEAKAILVTSSIPADLFVNKPNPVCYNDSVTFSVTPVAGATYTWKKNGVKVSTATGPSYKFAMKTNNTITVKIAKPGCAANTSLYTATVSPDATLSVSTYTICNDSSLISVPFLTGNIYQWKKNNSNISGATQNFYYAKTAGGYNVLITDLNSCTRLSSKANITVNCRDITDPDASLQFVSFEPNPVQQSGTLNLNMINDSKLQISMFDYMGREVKSINLNAAKGQSEYPFDLSTFSNGIYKLIVRSENGPTWHLNIAVAR